MSRVRLRVKGAVPAVLTANVVSGVVGGTLTNTPGTYTNNPTITRQWQNKIGAAYANIGGQTGTTLASVYATHGNNIRCLETATHPVSGGAVSQSAVAQYLGQVATNCRAMTASAGGNSPTMNRSIHYATDNITSLQIVIANWYWVLFNGSPPPVSKTESGSGGTATFKVTIEYPLGTTIAGTFLWSGGTTSAAIADGANAISDVLSGLNIPAGSLFAIREFATWGSTALCYVSQATYGSNTYDPADLFTSGAKAGLIYISATDLTASLGDLTPTVGGASAPIRFPFALIANTRVPSIAILGDSIGEGQFDKYDGDHGQGFARFPSALSTKVGFIQLCGQGETVANQKSNFAKRGAAVQYCSHVIQQGAINDFTFAVGNATAATVESNLTGAGGLLTVYAPNTPKYQCTILPPTTSTDSWATTANQTADGNNAQRVIFNNDMRAVPAPYAGCIEYADILESARDSGLRKVTGSAFGYTLDGVHPNQAAYQLARDAPIITTSTFVR